MPVRECPTRRQPTLTSIETTPSAHELVLMQCTVSCRPRFTYAAPSPLRTSIRDDIPTWGCRRRRRSSEWLTYHRG